MFVNKADKVLAFVLYKIADDKTLAIYIFVVLINYDFTLKLYVFYPQSTASD